MARNAVIDADGHIYERESDIRKYLAEPWVRRRTPLWPSSNQPWDGDMFETLGYDEYRAGISPAEQVERWLTRMEQENIEQTMLFPSVAGNLTKLTEKDYTLAVCRATNDHFAKDFNALSDRLHVVGMLPFQQPERAAEELRRAVEDLGMNAFAVLAIGLPKALGDSMYDPIYKAAEELGVPICVHANRHSQLEVGGYTLENFSEVHTYTMFAGVALQFTSMMAQGVPIRFPKLRLAFLEIGASWLTYWLDRMDEHWELRGELEMPLLREKPSEVFKMSPMFVSVEPDETLLPEVIRLVGDDHFLFASDYPHWDARFPENLNTVAGREDIPQESRDKILYHNSKQLFRL
ncbi:MAG: hypothetical protein C1O27_000670 [Chloroflexi bacterium]|jgi:predicted TIM-barrel fold metal-dependent hydrolase|nr:MAG: hypothetical protein C1O27_000670 [Chloroflexota bacterium]